MSVPIGGADPVVQATFTATLVDEWVRAGVTDAVVCPGSRSTPLALALAARAELRLHVRLDERGAGFFAIGLALATGRPPLVCTTSGTAAAELHPAVVEAHHARVPLLICTADRPPELHDVGAPQTIDQTGLFGRSVRWFAEPGVPVAATGGAWRSLASRAVIEATQGPFGPGPVHLNLAFREPLVAEPGDLPDGPKDGGPVHRVRAAEPDREPRGGRLRSWAGRQGIVVAGWGCGPPEGVLALGAQLGWPVLADPRSGCRRSHPNVVAAADAITRVPALRQALRPDVVVVLGEAWASKVLAGFLAEAAEGGAEVVAVDPWWRWADPDRIASSIERVDPAAWVAVERESLAAGSTADPWLQRWQRAEAAAQGAIDDVLADELARRGGALSEPLVARRLAQLLLTPVTLVAASSMPVRDLEWFTPPLASPPVVMANRGANGIDGVCSTAQGVAAAGLGSVVGLVGDLAFLHDVSSLARPAGVPSTDRCTLVVVDNGGGGIFNFLPQAAALDPARFEQLFGTPQAPDVAEVAKGFGLETIDVGTLDELRGALEATVDREGLAVVRARVPGRLENVALHERVHEAVAVAATSAVAGQR